MSNIGRPIGSQKSNIIVNTDAFGAMRQAVNIIRKPHFDERFFDYAQDQSGYYVSLNTPAVLEGITVNDQPFMISDDERYVPSASNTRQFKVQTGNWYTSNSNTLFGFNSATSNLINRGDGFWTGSLTDPATAFVMVERNDPDLSLNSYTTMPILTAGDARLIGIVTNHYGVMRWDQRIEGDIYDSKIDSNVNANADIMSDAVMLLSYNLNNIMDSLSTRYITSGCDITRNTVSIENMLLFGPSAYGIYQIAARAVLSGAPVDPSIDYNVVIDLGIYSGYGTTVHTRYTPPSLGNMFYHAVSSQPFVSNAQLNESPPGVYSLQLTYSTLSGFPVTNQNRMTLETTHLIRHMGNKYPLMSAEYNPQLDTWLDTDYSTWINGVINLTDNFGTGSISVLGFELIATKVEDLPI